MSLPANKSPSASNTPSNKEQPHPTAQPPKHKYSKYLLPAFVLVIILINAVLFFAVQQLTRSNRVTDTAPTPMPTFTPTPTPTPTPYPLPQGKRSFKLNYGKDATGPKIEDITVDPFDPKVGENQTYTVSVSHSSPVKSIDLSLTTDHRVATYSLQLISGNETRGKWQVLVTTDDTHLYEYYPYFIVKSDVDEFKGGLTLRAY
jgi:hypothetical protein